jgi:hypothetical protein
MKYWAGQAAWISLSARYPWAVILPAAVGTAVPFSANAADAASIVIKVVTATYVLI